MIRDVPWACLNAKYKRKKAGNKDSARAGVEENGGNNEKRIKNNNATHTSVTE